MTCKPLHVRNESIKCWLKYNVVSFAGYNTVKLWVEVPAASITTCQLCVILFKNHQPVCTSTSILFIFTKD